MKDQLHLKEHDVNDVSISYILKKKKKKKKKNFLKKKKKLKKIPSVDEER